jgi:hypothetical protein
MGKNVEFAQIPIPGDLDEDEQFQWTKLNRIGSVKDMRQMMTQGSLRAKDFKFSQETFPEDVESGDKTYRSRNHVVPRGFRPRYDTYRVLSKAYREWEKKYEPLLETLTSSEHTEPVRSYFFPTYLEPFVELSSITNKKKTGKVPKVLEEAYQKALAQPKTRKPRTVRKKRQPEGWIVEQRKQWITQNNIPNSEIVQAFVNGAEASTNPAKEYVAYRLILNGLKEKYSAEQSIPRCVQDGYNQSVAYRIQNGWADKMPGWRSARVQWLHDIVRSFGNTNMNWLMEEFIESSFTSGKSSESGLYETLLNSLSKAGWCFFTQDIYYNFQNQSKESHV